FRLLPDEDLEALASYVIHLSLRGEVEIYLIGELINKTVESDAGAIAETAKGALDIFASRWQAAENKLIAVGPYPKMNAADRKDSALRGMALFLSKGDAGCIGCHLDFGRKPNYSYDAWGTINKPTDLTLGVYRGGRRPVDLYYRIHSGINGSGMTAFG